jgi:DNA repair protein RadC
MSIKQWPVSEQPRERLHRAGPSGLSDAELLALLLGNGPAGGDALGLAFDLLDRCGELGKVLAAGPAELCAVAGVGAAKAARLQAALELGRRYFQGPVKARLSLRAPNDAARFFRAQLGDLPHEVFACLFLDTRHRLIRYEALFRGSIDGATVHPREVVKRALHHNAAAMIVGHNHPSGVAEPSEADRGITLKLVRALELMEIRLLDHLVVGREGHVSLAELGWI